MDDCRLQFQAVRDLLPLSRPPSLLVPPLASPIQVKALADEEGYSTWTTGIAEVQLSIE